MTFQDIIDRLQERLDEDAAMPTYWGFDEIAAAVNEAHRFICFVTLCIERTANFNIPASTAFVPILSNQVTPLADFIVPLRVKAPSGQRMMPAKIRELNVYSNSWLTTTDATAPAVDVTRPRYTTLGCDLFGIYPQFAAGGTLSMTYAASPAVLSLLDTTAVPEAPPEYHPTITRLSEYLLVTKQGGKEFANVIPYLKDCMADIQVLNGRMRSLMKAQGYDKMPFDLRSRDLSALFRVKLAKQPARAATEQA